MVNDKTLFSPIFPDLPTDDGVARRNVMMSIPTIPPDLSIDLTASIVSCQSFVVYTTFVGNSVLSFTTSKLNVLESALLLSFCENRFCLSQLLKKLNSTKRGALFRHFCVSKVITTAHAHKSGVIFHFFQELSNKKKLRLYDQR